jgi:hypothetical protein
MFLKGVKSGKGRNCQFYVLFPFEAIYREKIQPMPHETDKNKILNYWREKCNERNSSMTFQEQA